MIKILDILQDNSKVEFDLTFPKSMKEDVDKKMNIRYGQFKDNCWEYGPDNESTMTIYSPSVGPWAARKIIDEAPKYVDIDLVRMFPHGDEKNILKTPLKIIRLM